MKFSKYSFYSLPISVFEVTQIDTFSSSAPKNESKLQVNEPILKVQFLENK